MRATVIGISVIGSLLAMGVPGFGKTLARESNVIAMADGKTPAPKGEPVAIEKLPKAVADAVRKELPGARLTKAAKLSDGDYFLTDVKVGKKEFNVTVTPEGKILKIEEDND